MRKVRRMIDDRGPHRRQRAAVRRNGLRQGPDRLGHPPQLATASGFPFVKVGCALFPPQLIESELYGHEKGSFTGADQRRKGRFDLAEGGTLYLDDVDDIPLEQQAKLLRAIEEKVFERVGGDAAHPGRRADRSPRPSGTCSSKIADGTFREDLYYRLDVLRINIPPLRDSGATTCRCWSSTCCSGSPRTAPYGSNPRPSTCCSSTTGRGNVPRIVPCAGTCPRW